MTRFFAILCKELHLESVCDIEQWAFLWHCCRKILNWLLGKMRSAKYQLLPLLAYPNVNVYKMWLGQRREMKNFWFNIFDLDNQIYKIQKYSRTRHHSPHIREARLSLADHLCFDFKLVSVLKRNSWPLMTLFMFGVGIKCRGDCPPPRPNWSWEWELHDVLGPLYIRSSVKGMDLQWLRTSQTKQDKGFFSSYFSRLVFDYIR